jgi:hypothetical protein
MGDRVKVLLLAMGQDTGGVLSGIRRAFRNEPGWTIHTMVSTVNYIGYETDILWRESRLQHWWQWADVIHVQHRMVAIEWLTGGWHGFRLKPKSYVISFHGTNFRDDPEPLIRDMDAYHAIGLASTLDLWLLAPERIAWQPNPSDVDAMQRRRHAWQAGQELASVRGATTQGTEQVQRSPHRQLQAQAKEEAVIRIAHAPTNRQIKSTEEVIAAVERLQDDGFAVELDLIEGVNWDTCLDRKARADIYVDQVILGYGNNAIECWGMGIPVLAGAQPATLAEMERRFASLPFYRATEGTIYDRLKELVQSADLRAEYAERGLAHVRRFHDERVVVDQLKAIYRRAAGMDVEDAA